jgi:hypothetical protein
LTLQAAPALGFAGANSLLADPHPPDFFQLHNAFRASSQFGHSTARGDGGRTAIGVDSAMAALLPVVVIGASDAAGIGDLRRLLGSLISASPAST